MSRGGRSKDRSAPERRCIATGRTQDPGGLLRFVVGPDAQVLPDLMGRLPGRGIWVSADRAALRRAVDKKLFSRAARRPVQVAPDLPDVVEAALLRRVIELISLARKAGQAVAGYEKVKGWLVTEEARVLLQASDGSERGKSKLRPPSGNEGFIGCLTARELGLAFGRESVIHGALSAGGLATRVVDEAGRLSGVRENDGGMSTGKGTTDA
ncbi:RNA-binding protein [Brevirhabdus sp.]|uniref:RNA-binding protein n=1 Tax=Brevirhabdus sp. TaxID=2004514 RepID=UPI004058E59F